MSRTERVEGSRTVPTTRALDRQLPPRPAPLAPPSTPARRELESALLALQGEAQENESGLELELDPEEDTIRVFTRRDGKRRLLRVMSADELLRLARIARTGRRQFLDLKL